MLEDLLRAIVADPQAEDRWLVLADWLEEHDDPRRAELLRLHRKLLATCCEPERHPERAAWQERVVNLIGQGVRPCVPQRAVELDGGVEMIFNFIPPGSFLMGSPPQEEGRNPAEVQHRVTLTRGFWLGIYPVTQAQWRAVMGTNPSRFKGDDRPVENVSLHDCMAFCRRLGENYRLPTEAEWEWACRAGTMTPFHFGETISTDQANYDGKYTYGNGKKGVCRRKTTPVGSFPANPWGLYDMHGNVWEWCQDWYGSQGRGRQKDPQGPNFGVFRVLRGGAWCLNPWGCRSAYRVRYEPAARDGSIGYRVVVCPDNQVP